jgi:hypothetical protein
MKTLPLPEIVPLLREELAAYGGLLATFDQQQWALLEREVDLVVETSLAIEKLVADAAEHRQARENWVQRFAEESAEDSASSLTSLLSHFPGEVRPLLKALILEINLLIRRVRRRARQNHDLLSQTVALSRELRERLNPSAPRTYAPSGRMSAFPPSVGLAIAS